MVAMKVLLEDLGKCAYGSGVVFGDKDEDKTLLLVLRIRAKVGGVVTLMFCFFNGLPYGKWA